MKNKENKQKNWKNWLIYLVLGGFFVKIIKLILNNKDKISDFAKEEKREIEELKTKKQGFDKFCSDSASLLKHYFIPHEGNGHKPKILHPKSLISIIFLPSITSAAANTLTALHQALTTSPSAIADWMRSREV